MKQPTTTSINGGRKTKKAATKGKRKTKKCLGKTRKVRNRRRTYKKRGGGDDDEKLTNIKKEIDAENIDELTKRFNRLNVKFLKIINKDYINDNNLLIYAAKKGKLPVVDLFIKNGADINKTDTDGMTPISHASLKGHDKVVQALADNGANVNTPDNIGMTPLHRASQEGHPEVVEVLIQKGANVNEANKKGQPPIWWASYNGHSKVVEALIKAGADVEVSEKARAEKLADVKAARAKFFTLSMESCRVGCDDPARFHADVDCEPECIRARFAQGRALIAKGQL
jgi:hypothetical protein